MSVIYGQPSVRFISQTVPYIKGIPYTEKEPGIYGDISTSIINFIFKKIIKKKIKFQLKYALDLLYRKLNYSCSLQSNILYFHSPEEEEIHNYMEEVEAKAPDLSSSDPHVVVGNLLVNQVFYNC